MVGVGGHGVQKKDSEFKIHQSHLELLQAFALQINPEKMQNKIVGPDVVQDLWEAIINLVTAYHQRKIAEITKDDLEVQTGIKLLQDWIRSNTQMVRNWGYFSQVRTISKEIYSHFNEMLDKKYGFNADNIIRLFQLLIKEIEDANSDRTQSLRKLHQLKNRNDLVLQYYELIGESTEEANQFLEKIEKESIPCDSLFYMLLSHYDLRLPDIYEFSPTKLSGKIGMDEAKIKLILNTFSHEWGELETYKTEHLYLSNPVWKRPLIKIEANKYFCVFPQAFFSFVFPSLDGIVEKIDKSALSDRRAKYLETKIIEIINRRFPESNTVSGLKWKYDGTEYETDLITFIDSHAVIVEAKSGKISEPALRGAPDRLKKHIEEILVAPNIQSKRMKEKLEVLISNPEMDDKLRDKLPVNLKNIHKIIRVSISLEDFASIQSNISQLMETGWLPPDFEPCPTMTLADFETLFDFLEHPVQILHYLERRQEMERSLKYMGDELDLMGLYIGTLFNTGDIGPDDNLVISEMSAPLDDYYNSRDAGVDIPKPKPKISSLFYGIFEQLEKRQTPRWTEIGVALNRFSPDDQADLARMIVKLKKNVRKKWMIRGHKNMAIVVPRKPSEYSLCYIVYNNKNADMREEYIEEGAMYGLEPEHIKKCFVIAKNIDKNDQNYHFIGLMQ